MSRNGRFLRLPSEEKRLLRLVLIASTFLSAMLAFGVLHFDLLAFPSGHDFKAIVAWAALIVAALNMGLWIFFPFQDLQVLLTWLYSTDVNTPAGALEAFITFTASVLVLAHVVLSPDPIGFAAATTLLYTFNVLGFARINRLTRIKIDDTRTFFDSMKKKRRITKAQHSDLRQSIETCELHWGCGAETGRFWNRPQKRHFALLATCAFALVLALIGAGFGLLWLSLASQLLVTGAIISAEILHASWRFQRDAKLFAIARKLKAYPADLFASADND